MKPIKLFTALMLIFILVSCEKENTPVTVAPEDLTNYKVFKVHVQQLSNGQPVNNYELYFRMLKFYHISGSTQGVILKDTILYTVKTDANGNARFKIHKDSLTTDASIYIHKLYYIGGLENLTDSISNKNSNWNFKSPQESEKVYHKSKQLITELKFELISRLNCPAQIKIDENLWWIPTMDSLIISSNLVKHYNLNFHDETNFSLKKLGWAIDCDKTNKITYYYYWRGGQKSKEYSTTIDPQNNTFILNF